MFKSLVGGWVRLKLADKLPLPSLTLPVNLVQNHRLDAQITRVHRDHIELKAPERQIELTVEQARVAIQPNGLTLEIGSLKSNEGPAVHQPLPIRSPRGEPVDDLIFETSLGPLNQLLAAWFKPQHDVIIEASHVPDVWRKDSKLLGIKVRNRIDLHQVTGYLEIEPPQLAIRDNTLILDLDLRGQIDGRLQGRVYGLGLDKPFIANPFLKESLELRLDEAAESIQVRIKPETLALDVEFETRIAGKQVAFYHQFPLQSANHDRSSTPGTRMVPILSGTDPHAESQGSGQSARYLDGPLVSFFPGR